MEKALAVEGRAKAGAGFGRWVGPMLRTGLEKALGGVGGGGGT